MTERAIYTVRESAALLGIGASTVRHHIAKGHLAATKHGRDWLIAAEEVARFQSISRRTGPRSKEHPPAT